MSPKKKPTAGPGAVVKPSYRATTAGGLVEEKGTNLALVVAKGAALAERRYPAFVKDNLGHSCELRVRDGRWTVIAASADSEKFSAEVSTVLRNVHGLAVA